MPIPYYRIEYDAKGVPIQMVWCGFGPSLKEQIMRWREIAAPIIAKVITETESKDLHLLKQRLRDAYPFGERANHPYHIWCSEIQRQLDTKPPLQQGGRRAEPEPEEQGRLFS